MVYVLYRYLWILYIEDIYFFEVNTKYISTSAVKKNQYSDIFTAQDEIYLVFTE